MTAQVIRPSAPSSCTAYVRAPANPETKKGRHEAGPLESGWWRRGGSNSRPRHCERRALPAELRPHDQSDDTTALVDPKPAAPPAGGRAAVALWQTQHPGCDARLRHEAPMTQTGPPGFPDGPAGSGKDHGRRDAPSPIMPRISLMPAASAASRHSSRAAACGWSAGRRWARRGPRRPPGRSRGRYAPRLPGLPPDP